MKKERVELRKDAFYSHIFKLVLPIVIQNLLSAAVSSADVVMLNYVGQSSISAVSLAAQYASVLFMVFYGLGTGATILCAQYYGKGDMQAIQVVEGIAMRFSLLISLLFSGCALLLPEGGSQHGNECAGIFAEYPAECGIYLWAFRCAPIGSHGGRHSYIAVQAD